MQRQKDIPRVIQIIPFHGFMKLNSCMTYQKKKNCRYFKIQINRIFAIEIFQLINLKTNNMKNLFIALCLTLLVSGAMGQNLLKESYQAQPPLNCIVTDLSPVVINQNVSYFPKREIGDPQSVWINFAAQLAGTAMISYSPVLIFPDTFVRVRYQDMQGAFIYRYTNWASLGEALNPVSDYIQLPNLWDGNPYTVDSVRFSYFYERYGNNTIPDTAIVQVYKPEKLNYFQGTLGGKTALSAVAYFDRPNKMGKNAAFTYKIPLTQQDTNTFKSRYFGVKSIALPANFEITQGGPVGMTVTFKPGIPYKLNDTIPYRKYDSIPVANPLNAFFLGYYSDPSKEVVNENNNGMVVNGQNRYTDFNSTVFAGGSYLSGMQWLSPTIVDQNAWYALMFFKISYTEAVEPIGINNLTNDIKVKLFPNPVSTSQNLNVNLNLASANFVTVELFDLLGHKVATMLNSNLSAGENTVTMPASSLSSGTYVCKISAGNTSSSFKVSVR